MQVNSVEIENFKSFFETQRMEFGPGFNVILGANNSGKSTVLQAIDPCIVPSAPHRSIANVRAHEDPVGGLSRIRLNWSLSVEDLYRLNSSEPLHLPYPQHRHIEFSSEDLEVLRRRLFGIHVRCEFERSPSTARFGISGELLEPIGLGGGANAQVFLLQARSDGVGLSLPGPVVGNWQSELHRSFVRCGPRVFRFLANRWPEPHAALSKDGVLTPTASNLAGCLTNLQTTDPEGHRELCLRVNRVLPQVHAVLAPPHPQLDGLVQLRCYPRPTTERRSDLSVPINEMGAGVATVVAILYVLQTARHPQVICIDEPNQYLHPKALRELLGILATEGEQHQYILTAHSGDVVGALRPQTVTLLQLDEGATRVRQSKHGDLATLRAGLADIGVRATELHGRDHVLWVEGQTEEQVLPTLLMHFCKEHAAGTAVLRVQETGAFEKKGVGPIQVVEIYKRLTEGSALVPPMVAVVLDRERRKPEEVQKLESDVRGRLRFLPRRMLENYLLHPGAICAVLNELESDCCDEAKVRAKLCEAGQVQDLDELDLDQVDGAALLSKVFSDLTTARFEFRKTRDVPSLAEWLVVNDKVALAPLGDWLGKLLLKAAQ